MNTFKKTVNISGWLVFLISFIVLGSSVESTGSLWDCGEFILGAYKLQVVHPPGAPLFVLVGRMFALMGELISSEPSGVAVAVNLMSAMCTAFAAMFIAWVTMLLGKMALVGRDTEPDTAGNVALAGAGLASGLATAFTTSIWFSAVEGEVYAMSTFFTALVLWAMVKWYHLPDDPKNDRWVLFAVYAAALSIGVHLLSLLTFPALALFYYYKKFKQPSLKGAIAAAAVGVAFIVGIQSLIITGLPKLWLQYELMMVNGFGFGFHTGLIPLVLTVGVILYFALRYAHQKQNVILQQIIVGAFLSIVGFSTVGIVVIRANANPPVNMNDNYDAARLLPYLNREQYGERPLLRGPQFNASPVGTKITDRYGRVGDRYEVVDHKVDYEYKDADITLFPRMGHYDERRKQLYRIWMNGKQSNPNFADNVGFFIRYQINWMYWRYFMWNFAGRQNGDQGYFPWDPSRGHWISGIPFIDNARLFDQSTLPTVLKEDEARNRYFLLPLSFGLLGILFHFRKNRKDFFALLSLFIITGIGIIVYSNQPPNEPRERDYVLVGSFFTFAIWIGMGALYLFQLLNERVKSNATLLAVAASAAVLTAPIIMGFENYDDHSRRGHTASRDYASNFLNSCAPNALIFTYGDNDTYPLWYAQEVEGIRTDVRVVNLSLIAVDWYIDQMRRKVNDSPAIKFTIPKEEYRGKKRNQVFYHSPDNVEREMSLLDALKFIGESHPLRGTNITTESYLPAKRLYIPINRVQAINSGWATPEDEPDMVDRIYITIENNYLTKDELAILDIIASNIYERPIYFSVTCTEDKLFNLGEHMQLEGLGHRLMPVRSRPTRGLGIYGLGRLGEEQFLDNVLNKFKWSSFAEHKTYIDRSYNASVYAHKMVLLRAAYHFMAKKDYENAIKVIDQSLAAFPHFNFPYDGTTMALLNMYADADAYDKAKPHMEIMAQHVLEYMEFFNAIGPAKVEAGYGSDKRDMDRTMTDLITIAQQAGDDTYADQLIEMFRQFIDTEALKKQLMDELDPELLEQLQMELQGDE
jgi:hypothetical protein